MLGIILLSFILVPLIEIGVFIQVGGLIGLWPTLGLIVLTAVVGTALLRQQGLSTLRRARETMARHELPVNEVFDGVCLVAAGALLLTPGFITDALGTALLLPPFRALIRGPIVRRVMARADFFGPGGAPGGPGATINGEFSEDDNPDDPPATPPRL